MENEVNFGGIGLGLLRFCLQHSDGNVGETDLTQYGHTSAEYEWLKAALNNLESDTQRMKQLVLKLQQPENTNEIIWALEGIQFFVEDLDLANDLAKVDGTTHIVNFLTHENADVRRWSAWIIASLTQNNPVTQKNLSEKHNILEVLVNVLLSETNFQTKDKQLYALSAVTSGNESLMNQFVDNYNGIPVLVALLQENFSGIQFKVIWFLKKLLLARPENKVLARNSDIVVNLVKILGGSGLKEDVRERAAETLLVVVNNDKEKARECKGLGLDKILVETLKKFPAEAEQEEKKVLKELLRVILVQ